MADLSRPGREPGDASQGVKFNGHHDGGLLHEIRSLGTEARVSPRFFSDRTMPPPYDRTGELVPLGFNLAEAELAVEWLPKPDKEFRRACKRWTDHVRSSKLLTPAQSKVGLTIADVYINRQPNHPWFNWAWPSHQLLAEKTGLTRRTVLSAVERLSALRLLKIARGGGAKGLGGRTHRYTLDMAGLAASEAQIEQTDREKDAKNLHSSQNRGGVEDRERGEIRDTKTCNPQQEDVKRLRTNLRNPLRKSITAPTSNSAAARKEPCRGSKTILDSVTSTDHTNLAICVGEGNLRKGYERLQKMPEDEIDALALQLRREPSAGDSIRLQVDIGLRNIDH